MAPPPIDPAHPSLHAPDSFVYRGVCASCDLFAVVLSRRRLGLGERTFGCPCGEPVLLLERP